MFLIEGPTPGVPWYIHPAEAPVAWKRLLCGDYGFGFVVINANNGPGAAPDDAYYGPALRDGSRTTCAGYVNVDYGRRPWQEILADARHWREWYGVLDVMLDCVPPTDHAGDWSVEHIDALREDGAGRIIANPGVVPTRRLVETADVTCVAEQRWDTYRTLELPEWLRGLPPERQWHLVHGVPPEHLHDIPAMAAAHGAWFSWATDHVEPNPWNRLPCPYNDPDPDETTRFEAVR